MKPHEMEIAEMGCLGGRLLTRAARIQNHRSLTVAVRLAHGPQRKSNGGSDSLIAAVGVSSALRFLKCSQM